MSSELLQAAKTLLDEYTSLREWVSLLRNDEGWDDVEESAEVKAARAVIKQAERNEL